MSVGRAVDFHSDRCLRTAIHRLRCHSSDAFPNMLDTSVVSELSLPGIVSGMYTTLCSTATPRDLKSFKNQRILQQQACHYYIATQQRKVLLVLLTKLKQKYLLHRSSAYRKQLHKLHHHIKYKLKYRLKAFYFKRFYQNFHRKFYIFLYHQPNH